jgi:hypothetical protein
MTRLIYGVLLVLAVTILLIVQWHGAGIAVLLVLLVLLAAPLGYGRPPAQLDTGFVLGLAMPVVRVGSYLTGLHGPAYHGSPPSRADWVTMAAFVVTAVAAACAGAWLRRRRPG